MKKILYPTFAILMLAAMTFLMTSSTFAAKRSSQLYTTKTFKLSSGDLYVLTSGGYIRVEGSNSNEVKVEVYVNSGKYNDNKTREIVENDYEIRIERTGSRIEAVAKRTGSMRWNNISISFVIYTPRDFNCELKTSGGSLKITGVRGSRHELYTSGGSITADDASGDMKARTSGGNINISDYQGDIDVRTSGGGIKLEDVKGNIDVVTSGGGIRVTDVEGSLYAATSGGSINAEITRLTDELTLKTSGGNIRATIPKDLGIDLDLRGNRVVTTLSNFSGETKTSRVTGTVNGGGIPVTLVTSGGSIYLDYQ